MPVSNLTVSGHTTFRVGSSVAERPPTASAGGRQVEGANPSPRTKSALKSTNGYIASTARRTSTRSNAPEGVGSIPSGRTKLYAVVDSKLAPGAKACQAAHALRAYAAAYPYIEAQWWQESNTLVLLECDDLVGLEVATRNLGATFVRFVEPDWAPDGVLTALVIGPDGKTLVHSLPLMFTC